MTAWNRAFAGKTFVPDVNYFADWVSKKWSGGGRQTFSDDFEAQGWFWTERGIQRMPCLIHSVL